MISKILTATAAISLGVASAAYAEQAPAGTLWNATTPSDGGNGEVVSPNALPPGFSDDTEQGVRAQAVARWFAAHGDPAYAAAQPNG